MADEKNHSDFMLELCALDNSMILPAKIIQSPVWESVNTALENAFKNGGFVELKALGSSLSFIDELCMTSLPGCYRLVVVTKSNDPKEELHDGGSRQIYLFEASFVLATTTGMRARCVQI